MQLVAARIILKLPIQHQIHQTNLLRSIYS